jgi:hypothetical protein
MGTGGSFPGGKARPGRDADHSPPSSAEVKKERSYTSSAPQTPPAMMMMMMMMKSLDKNGIQGQNNK